MIAFQLPSLDALWTLTTTVLNSDFVRSLLVAFTGALFGALTAKRIAERTKLKDDLLKEIRNLNAASVVAHSIANAHLALKKQHVKQMYETFVAKRDELNEKRAQLAAGVPSERVPFEIVFDLQSVAPLTQPILPLQTLIFDRVSATAKAIMLMGVLSQTYESLNDTLTTRNGLIETWRQRALPQDQILPLYFGLPRVGGIDQTYPTLVDAAYSYADDVICFSKMLGDELAGQASEAKKRFERHFPRAERPLLTTVEFPEIGGLMPPREKFTDFGRMFRERESEQKAPFWRRAFRKRAS